MSAPIQSTANPFDAAVEWIVKIPPEKRMRASVPVLRELFGLSALQAVDVLRRANAIRYGTAATTGGADVVS
jgi:hypothetical protein